MFKFTVIYVLNSFSGNVDIVPEHMPRWNITLMDLYVFLLLQSYMNYAEVPIGHRRRLEEPVPRDPEAPRTLEDEVEVQAPRTEEVERLEAGFSINKTFFFVSNFLSSTASGGIFAFLQMSKEKAKPTLKHIYIACSVCLATSIVVVVAGVALILIPWKSGLKSLILKLATCATLVLFMSDSFLAIIAFNIGS
ncbi:uncharacterized protein LOC122089298 [Macadamia integrifolia]|uniref:uncharacterized protein LOC122089298 n=1 Tax=Macadamia integrifolia TaxID=60698 RepID=UPI001C4F8958|nr:uncharacterized protein LOC122089298 [Macadamia integrifolia]